ncbi:DUF2156 domain-containing protein [Epibacterium sp. SM1969]|uniref:DUF2156 domain-containing protein n=1 Tax=Tritonibacter aquimaris TaxID=2663379 RepID=A0A844ATN3_9RHOB|nr:phosphatidylglycerol lysyltransferase domain-containing protein [Tritonibacter aquimaris]MQY41292.1 DUF2156 domain-containing protein [Tritonibacter aquimaris]
MVISKKVAQHFAARAMRLFVPVLSAAICFWLLSTSIRFPSLAELTHLMGQIPLLNWGGAALATIISFWALGRYDGVAHRHLNTGLDGLQARLAGMLAIAFSQTAGFGILTGGFARWRLLRKLSPVQAAQLTALTGLTFMAALAAVCGLALLAWGPFPYARLLGIGLMVAFAAACAATFFWPELRLGRHKMRWPSLTALTALALWTLVDVVAAGTALWLLMPPGSGIQLTLLLPAYFLALGLAVLSSSPGGTGPLELTLVTLLSAHDPTTILAGLVAFRLVYYLAPAVLACVALVWPRLIGPRAAAPEDVALLGSRRDFAHTIPFERARSETGVIRQNGGHLRSFGFNQLAMLDTPQSSVALFDPVRGYAAEIFAPLHHYAAGRNAAACLYKCSPRAALAARKANWKILRIASEAVITPRGFSENGSSKRQLRRKLRHAEKAGIDVRDAAGTLPLSQLAEVDQNWHNGHGAAHGTTMGQFEPEYIKGQKVFIAWQESRIIGFVSFHLARDEWCLDLIRMGPDVPDGTGHIMIRAAIAAAAEAGVARLSLAAVPDHRFAHRVERGLRRFKGCFAPHWQPQYMAAPSWPQMALSLVELIRLVHRPAPLQPAKAWQPADLSTQQPSKWDSAPHNEDEQNEFVFPRRA